MVNQDLLHVTQSWDDEPTIRTVQADSDVLQPDLLDDPIPTAAAFVVDDDDDDSGPPPLDIEEEFPKLGEERASFVKNTTPRTMSAKLFWFGIAAMFVLGAVVTAGIICGSGACNRATDAPLVATLAPTQAINSRPTSVEEPTILDDGEDNTGAQEEDETIPALTLLLKTSSNSQEIAKSPQEFQMKTLHHHLRRPQLLSRKPPMTKTPFLTNPARKVNNKVQWLALMHLPWVREKRNHQVY